MWRVGYQAFYDMLLCSLGVVLPPTPEERHTHTREPRTSQCSLLWVHTDIDDSAVGASGLAALRGSTLL